METVIPAVVVVSLVVVGFFLGIMAKIILDDYLDDRQDIVRKVQAILMNDAGGGTLSVRGWREVCLAIKTAKGLGAAYTRYVPSDYYSWKVVIYRDGKP